MLSLDRATLRFGGVTVLDAIDLHVGHGEVLGLLGPNGSGKTSLINVVTGIYPLSEGRVLIDGEDATFLPLHEIVARGVARTVQATRLFDRLTVLENVRPAQGCPRVAVEALLEKVGLADRRHAMASTLGFADRRRLDLARALALQPKLLLLDEPASALTAAETNAMAELLARIALPGRAVIVVEHKIDLIATLCPRAAVLHMGRKVAEGLPAEIRDDDFLREVYFGDRETADA
ncbi:ABC transporter ATP-binding protein [Mesorhizobium yinganensis]|uniref:ABC transporter ATP-binding protein n=1 Tax=Mesorhizobium yinganensis TaxID=3157707 RepID=UPI0032B710D7